MYHQTDLGQEFGSKEIVLGRHSMGNVQQCLYTCLYNLFIYTYIHMFVCLMCHVVSSKGCDEALVGIATLTSQLPSDGKLAKGQSESMKRPYSCTNSYLPINPYNHTKEVPLILREFPGTPRNGTPFWEASHTIPIPLP